MVVIFAVGAAEQGRRDAGDGGNLLIAGGDVLNDLLTGQLGEVGMVGGMVHHLVAVIRQGLYRFRIFFHPIAHHKKSGVYLVLVQNVDQLLGVLVPPGRVEGQGHHLLVPLH